MSCASQSQSKNYNNNEKKKQQTQHMLFISANMYSMRIAFDFYRLHRSRCLCGHDKDKKKKKTVIFFAEFDDFISIEFQFYQKNRTYSLKSSRKTDKRIAIEYQKTFNNSDCKTHNLRYMRKELGKHNDEVVFLFCIWELYKRLFNVI